nr:hypothetical protein [Tanacetum cinerariifolium]
MFDEYFNPSPSVTQPIPVAVVQEPIVSTSTPSSTRIDQDTPSTSTLQTIKEAQSHVIPTSVEEDDHGHLSDTKVLIMKMEILLEPTSNKLLVGDMLDPLWIKLVTNGEKQ